MHDTRRERVETHHERHHHFAHPHRNVAALQVDPGMRVADFGAGSGAYVLALAAAMHGTGHVYAIDIQKDLLRRLATEAGARGLKNVEVLWGDLEVAGGSKIASDSLDLVLVSNLLFQVEDKRAVMHEAARIVRLNGRVAVIDWKESYRGMGPERDAIVSSEDVRTLATSVDLTYVNDFAAGAHHFGCLFKKGPHRSKK